MSNASALGMGPTSQECAGLRAPAYVDSKVGSHPTRSARAYCPPSELMPARPTDSCHLARTLLDEEEVAASMQKQQSWGTSEPAPSLAMRAASAGAGHSARQLIGAMEAIAGTRCANLPISFQYVQRGLRAQVKECLQCA
jgi:hypothetical protein